MNSMRKASTVSTLGETQVLATGQICLGPLFPDRNKLTEPMNEFTLADLPLQAPKSVDIVFFQVAVLARSERGQLRGCDKSEAS